MLSASTGTGTADESVGASSMDLTANVPPQVRSPSSTAAAAAARR
jgi:hypothetical protein